VQAAKIALVGPIAVPLSIELMRAALDIVIETWLEQLAVVYSPGYATTLFQILTPTPLAKIDCLSIFAAGGVKKIIY